MHIGFFGGQESLQESMVLGFIKGPVEVIRLSLVVTGRTVEGVQIKGFQGDGGSNGVKKMKSGPAGDFPEFPHEVRAGQRTGGQQPVMTFQFRKVGNLPP